MSQAFDVAWAILKGIPKQQHEQYRSAYEDAKARGYRFNFEQWLIQTGITPLPPNVEGGR